MIEQNTNTSYAGDMEFINHNPLSLRHQSPEAEDAVAAVSTWRQQPCGAARISPAPWATTDQKKPLDVSSPAALAMAAVTKFAGYFAPDGAR
jgi:hypothetical protein